MDPKHARTSVDPSVIPASFRAEIDRVLPPPVTQALYAGCHEADFLLAAETLMRLTLSAMGSAVDPSFMAAYYRVREARLHVQEFSDHMEMMAKEPKDGIVVAHKDTLDRLDEELKGRG